MATKIACHSREVSEILAGVGDLEDGAIAAGLAYTVPTIRAIGKVWVRHPRRLPFPSQELLAVYAHRSARTVRRHIAELVAAGLLEVFRNAAHRAANGQRRRKTNAYLLRSRAARAKTRQSRRWRLEDTRGLKNVNAGAVGPAPPWFDPPEDGIALTDRCAVAALRAKLAGR